MKRGFTLIELLVVITIIGIVLGIATLYFPKIISRIYLNQVTDRIVSSMEDAMQNSIVKGVENSPVSPKYKLYGVVFDNSSTALVVKNCIFTGDIPDNLTSENCSSFSVEKNLTVSLNQDEVIFNKRGLTTHDFSLILNNKYGYSKTISTEGSKINVK